MTHEPIAHIEFAGGPMWPVFEDGSRQYVVDDDGKRVYGVWFIPRDDVDLPLVIQSGETGDDEFTF
jgi:hypothetical protein